MTTTAARQDDHGRPRLDERGRRAGRESDLLRHRAYTRVVHWVGAIGFVLALLSGFALYTPWLFRTLTPLFGGGTSARLLHPWFGLAFAIAFGLQVLNWSTLMRWTRDDRRWLRHLKDYVTNASPREPDYVGFFNAGQKIYFWAIVASGIAFLVSGIPLWFPNTFPSALLVASYVVHDLAALVMLEGFIAHLYEATAAQPGTFRAMIRGTVDKRWAWTHHPAWYREATGRDPRADYERAASGGGG